jgi:hypothetical protein
MDALTPEQVSDSQELTVQCSATRARTNQATLSDKLTQSLISAGLVKGIIPTSMRTKSNPVIPAIASWLQDGGNVEQQKADF